MEFSILRMKVMLSQQLTPEVCTQGLENPSPGPGLREVKWDPDALLTKQVQGSALCCLHYFSPRTPACPRGVPWAPNNCMVTQCGSSMCAQSKLCGHRNSPWWESRQMYICPVWNNSGLHSPAGHTFTGLFSFFKSPFLHLFGGPHSCVTP